MLVIDLADKFRRIELAALGDATLTSAPAADRQHFGLSSPHFISAAKQ